MLCMLCGWQSSLEALEGDVKGASGGGGNVTVAGLHEQVLEAVLGAVWADGSPHGSAAEEVRALTRYSAVCRGWRRFFAGCPLALRFDAPLCDRQLAWLRRGRRLVRSLELNPLETRAEEASSVRWGLMGRHSVPEDHGNRQAHRRTDRRAQQLEGRTQEAGFIRRIHRETAGMLWMLKTRCSGQGICTAPQLCDVARSLAACWCMHVYLVCLSVCLSGSTLGATCLSLD
jgi:hypothetical protein